MRIFISAGEPSGDLHGANFIRAFRQLRPDVEFVGFGGDKMQAAGCRLIYPLCRLAVMWFLRVLANLHVFADVLSKADRFFRHHRPDAVVLIDYPGLHWWLARRAHFHGIPVFYFVPPQIWAWGGWRVKKMRRWVDHVLCTLPFEQPWYEARGVQAHYVGHPYFDEMDRQRLDGDFIDEERRRGGPIVTLLPGSRTQEVEHNFPTMLRAAQRLHQQLPGVRFLVGCFKDQHKQWIEQTLAGTSVPIDLFVGRTPEVIHLADACLAVSGSVSLELLYHAKPTIVLYMIDGLSLKVCRYFMESKYISLVNLLAGREVFPEHLTDRCPSQAIAEQLELWLTDPAEHARRRGELLALRERFAQPGACERAAKYVHEILCGTRLQQQAA